ncbi:precorrin-3B synthase [Gordonia sp. CPCC 205515]|uniref:precorrin-3B synthase n=1 Tax=Gordonia sp. CPCC 205515 TaxID=3140791 RepID=UPI003AF3BB21
MSQPSPRSGTDRCPGVFSTHAAADGAVARIRLPGGRIRPDQLEKLAQAAAEHGDGYLELTARGNLQLRGIGDVEAVAEVVVAAGLAPSSSHDMVRNIEVSALTGRIGGVADGWPLADRLDERLRVDDAAAELSGRFLFGIDDGRGDVLRRGPDVCALLHDGEGDTLRADIVVGGAPLGSATGLDAIVSALLEVAHAVLEIAPGAWRIADLSDEQRGDLELRIRATLGPVIGGAIPDPGDPIVGWFDQDDGQVLLGAVVELGRLPARLGEFVAAVGAPIIVTPDREIILCDLDEGVAETVVRVLAPMGLIFDANSPWARVSCCVGAPGCAKSHAPVREDLLEYVDGGVEIDTREHWVGCDRGCGAPSEPHVRVEADPQGGYRTQRR